MALTFLTAAQQMVFVDADTHTFTDAGSLLPNHEYDVFFTVANPDPVAALNVEIEVNHSAFGIGLPGGPSLITPHPVVIPVVPPAAFGHPGQATASFHFSTPAAGHGCIVAQIQPNGAVLNQNTSVLSVPQGSTSNLSFLVFGFASAEVLLQLSESEQTTTGTPVIPAPLWHPIMVPPAGVGSVVVSPTELRLTGLAHSAFYTVGLQVTTPASFSNVHIITIKGFNPADGSYLGEVQFVLNPLPASEPSEPAHPYILGGYQSEDIILTDPITGAEVMLGGTPGGRWDTLLRPNTDYGFSARIHNSSGTPAVNTIVRFWRFPGGVAATGELVDIQSVTVPANGSVIVHSEHPFRSAGANQHSCAVVSIYNATAGSCATDAVHATDVPNPGADHSMGCAAWRNTDSQWVWPGLQWHMNLNTGLPHRFHGPEPIEVTVETHHAPANFRNDAAAKKLSEFITANGLQVKKPLFLLPSLREVLKPVDLGIRVIKHDGVVAKRSRQLRHLLDLRKDVVTNFRVEGTIPETVQKGDVILVKIIAHYAGQDKANGKNVEFLQVLHVTDERKA